MNNDNINATTQWGGMLRFYYQKDKQSNPRAFKDKNN